LEEAGKHLSLGLERSELGGDLQALIAGYLIAGRLRLAMGDVEAAVDYFEKARPLVENASFPEWSGLFARFRVDLWLAQDNLQAAVRWAEEMLRAPEPHRGQESEVAKLAAARVLVAKGDAPSLDRAFALLDRLRRSAESEGKSGVCIEGWALQALAQRRHGDQASALTSLERALRMAEPEGYVRLFADLGVPMARLLQEARSRGVMSDYVAKLLAVFGADVPTDTPTARVLSEPLGPREEEVLQLIAAGLTNREIAEKLIISPETVKKHTGSIFGKLGVGNRTEAAARARELGLLE
jgi:LuxR family transcriptional regulator, maltose regulon positive regulatory protein